MLSQLQMKSDLKSLGIQKNDILHIHSAMRALGPVENGFDGVIQAFQEVVGAQGIVSMPTHSWDIVTKKQPVFHINYTPSNLGAFPNAILKGINKGSGFKRSLHPTHSIVAWGEGKELFLETDKTTPCPPNGSYGKLLDGKGKIVLLGVNLTKCTFLHCLEEITECGDIWSLEKKPHTLHVFDSFDKKTSVEFREHHDCISESFYKIENDLLLEGIMTQGFVGPCPVKIVDAALVADWLIPRLKDNPKFFSSLK